MTLACLIVVPATGDGGYIYDSEAEKSYAAPMALLLIQCFVMLVNENSKMFIKRPKFVFDGMKRLITVGVCSVFWLVTLILTLTTEGKELVWKIWLVYGLIIGGFQMLYICVHVCLDEKLKREIGAAKKTETEEVSEPTQKPSGVLDKDGLIALNQSVRLQQEFELSEDFYALCFIAYMNKNTKKYDLTRKRQSRFFYSVLWVFMLQAALLYLALNELVFAP